MKFAAFLATVGFSLNAFAVQTFECAIQTKDLASGEVSEKVIHLVDGRRALVLLDDEDTKVDLGINVTDGKMDAYVANRGVYVLPAAVTSSLNTSVKTDKLSTSISCKNASEAKFVFINQFTRAVSVNTADVTGCYLGDAKSAARAYLHAWKLTPVDIKTDAAKNIKVALKETYCARDNGESHEAFECFERKTRVRTRTVPHCSSTPKTAEVCINQELVAKPPRHMDEDVHWSRYCSEMAKIRVLR